MKKANTIIISGVIGFYIAIGVMTFINNEKSVCNSATCSCKAVKEATLEIGSVHLKLSDLSAGAQAKDQEIKEQFKKYHNAKLKLDFSGVEKSCPSFKSVSSVMFVSSMLEILINNMEAHYKEFGELPKEDRGSDASVNNESSGGLGVSTLPVVQ